MSYQLTEGPNEDCAVALTLVEIEPGEPSELLAKPPLSPPARPDILIAEFGRYGKYFTKSPAFTVPVLTIVAAVCVDDAKVALHETVVSGSE